MAKSTIIKDISNLNENDLSMRIADEKKRYNKMKHLHSVTPIENPVMIKKLRRDIARMLHLLSLKKANQTV